MDRRLGSHPRGTPVTLTFEGDPVRAYEGEPVAVALFASGVDLLSRSIKYHRPRAFFCLDGHCAACLMRIDGVPSLRSCQVLAQEGLRCERQNAFPSAGFDLLSAADWLFASGMDHHTLLAKQPLLRPVLEKMVRELGGLGHLPDAPAPALPRMRRRKVDTLILGAGAAGLSCAAEAARRGHQVLLLDEGHVPGGTLLAEPGGPARAQTLAAQATRAGAELLPDATVLGWFPEDDGGLFAVRTGKALLCVSAERTVFATGTYAQNLLCEDNDRPGVLADRAVGRLLFQYGVLPGHNVALVGPSSYGDRLQAALEQAGAATRRLPTVARVLGGDWVEAVELEDGQRFDCDLVAACTLPVAASDLARQQGLAVASAAERFAIVQTNGETGQPGRFACGHVAGAASTEQAQAQGEALGRRI